MQEVQVLGIGPSLWDFFAEMSVEDKEDAVTDAGKAQR